MSEKKTQDVFHKFNLVKSSLLLKLPGNYAKFYTANSFGICFQQGCVKLRRNCCFKCWNRLHKMLKHLKLATVSLSLLSQQFWWVILISSINNRCCHYSFGEQIQLLQIYRHYKYRYIDISHFVSNIIPLISSLHKIKKMPQ